jgi:cyclohexadienyl dehydratase
MEAGKFDIAMGGISVTEARARIGLFSAPMMSDGKTPITLCKNAARFQTLDQIDRKGVRLVVNPGGTNEKFARAHIHVATITVHPDNTTIFQEIVAGRADLMITDAIETRLQSKLHPELCAIHPDTPFDHAEKAYFMPKDEALKAKVDAWLEGLRKSGALKATIAKWVE